MAYHEITKEYITEDASGNITVDTTKEIREIKKSEEPDYIKLYTKMWLDFNRVPEKYQKLFLSLVCHMDYANAGEELGGQIVYTIGTIGKAIMKECGWKTKDPLYKGLKALCDCNAIRKIGRGEYQVNPQYAGRGSWNYNPKTNNGGVKDLIAEFNFTRKTVKTNIVWASADEDEIGKSAGQVIATKTTKTKLA